MSVWPCSTEEEPRIAAESGTRYPLLNRLTRLLCDLESDGLARFLLYDRSPTHHGATVNHVARSQLHQLVSQCSAEKNRLHKILTDAGIRLNVVVSDIHGKAARAMIKALIDGRPLHEVLDRKGRLRASREELFEALGTERFSPAHRFVATEVLAHIEKKAIVALAHKLLRIIYAMLRNRTHYQDSTIDYEALTVARNAPRWLKMLRKHGFITDQAVSA